MSLRRRTWLAIGSTILASTALGGTGSAQPTERTDRATYLSPAAGVALVGDGRGVCTNGFGCVEFVVERAERSVGVGSIDASGQPALLVVHDLETGEELAAVCGESEQPIPLAPGTTGISVWIYSGACADATPALATHGEVIATFSKRKMKGQAA